MDCSNILMQCNVHPMRQTVVHLEHSAKCSTGFSAIHAPGPVHLLRTPSRPDLQSSVLSLLLTFFLYFLSNIFIFYLTFSGRDLQSWAGFDGSGGQSSPEKSGETNNHGLGNQDRPLPLSFFNSVSIHSHPARAL